MEGCWDFPLEFIRLGGIRFNADLASMLVTKIRYHERSEEEEKYRYAYLTSYEMKSNDKCGDSDVKRLTMDVSLKDVISDAPSVLNEGV
ncbi:MAG: hypothetical protein ACI4NP_04760 [Thermoguttaceae bacterium]